MEISYNFLSFLIYVIIGKNIEKWLAKDFNWNHCISFKYNKWLGILNWGLKHKRDVTKYNSLL